MSRKGTTSIHEAAKALGSRGGSKGGPARAKALTSLERSQIARKGGAARAKKK